MKSSLCSHHLGRSALLVAAALLAANAVRADERLFTYVQEAEVLPKGGLEFEQWLTHRSGKADESSFEFEGISTELKYRLFNPNTKPVGVLLYGEATYNGDEFELEEKLVLQKNFGEKWVAAFNVTLEQEWAFTPADTEEELKL